jgi:glutamate synthase (NADPH/NADH) small chain
LPYRKDRWRTLDRENPPKRPAVERVADFLEISAGFTEEMAIEQASRCVQCPNPTCTEGCPLSNRIPEWLALTAEGRFLEAAEISRSTSNLPEICGKVCPGPCEANCIIDGKAEPVSIGAIERFINEYAFTHGSSPDPPFLPNGYKVAIVGSGPGGLSCGAELTKLGYAVTIYESQKDAGGLLVHGIPSFKLDKAIVERRIRFLENRGVKFHLGVTIGVDVQLSELRRDYDAIFLAIGAYKAKPLRIPGSDLKGVEESLPFLIKKNIRGHHEIEDVEVHGRRVVVLGGGDTAMDCLRTALRAGAASATCVYRRDEDNMPGSRKEYTNSVEEGAEFQYLTNPVEVLGDESGHVAGLRCVRMELGEPGEDGRRRPAPVEGSEFDIPADIVLVAFGFDPIPFPDGCELAGIKRNQWGGMIVDENKMTSIEGVYAGGDIVRGASLVVHAIRDARRAAEAIHRTLAGKEKKAEPA